MAKFVLSERTKRDLVDIWRYTLENWSEEQAIRYYNKLMDGCEHIASTPDTVGRDYEKVRIVRILHGKMDYPKHLF